MLAAAFLLTIGWGLSRLFGGSASTDQVGSSPDRAGITSSLHMPTATPTAPPARSGTTANESGTAVPANLANLRGAGTFLTAAVPRPDSTGSGRVVTYVVQVEKGLGADASALAAAVQSTLTDARGWQTAQKVRFVHLTPADLTAGKKPDVTVVFAAPSTVDKLCAPLHTDGQVSCASQGRAVLNYGRWVAGVTFFGHDLAGYRQYMVNHEVGHLLGFGHKGCPVPGKPAPVMMQQTLGLGGCTPNPWPTVAH